MRSIAMVCGSVLLPLFASVVSAQYGTTAVPTAALTSASAGGGGSGSGSGANIACPAVSFAQRVDPIGGGLYRVIWTADKAADPSKTLQSIASVDLHYRVNQAPMINVRMPPADATGKAFAVQTPLNSGDTLSYYVTYSALIDGSRVDCDSALFTNTASTAALTSGAGMGVPGFGADPSNAFGVQPLQTPPNSPYGSAGPQALSGVPSNSQGNCPAITFNQAINRDAVMGSAHTIVFTALQPVAAAGAQSQSPPQMQVMYVDVHFRINSGPEINVRLNPNPTDGKSWSLPGLNLMEGDSVSYYFTYCVLLNGVRSDCDTSRLTFTRVTGGAGSSTTPLSTQLPSTAGIQLGAGNGQPFAPQFPQLPQALTASSNANPNPNPNPTAPASTSTSGGGNGIGTPSSAGSAVCPAVTWQWQLLPATNAPNTFTVQFTAQSPVNPTLTLKNIASVDLHYVLNSAPVNVRMLQISPNAWASNIVVTNANTAQLQFYFTYSAAFQSNTITCDTAQQTLTGASGAFSGGTASGQSSLPVSPSAVGAGSAAGAGTGSGQTQSLLTAPQVINPFTQTGQAPSGFPPGTPQFAQGQVLPGGSTNPFSGATPQFLQPSGQPANPSGPPAPGTVPAGPGVAPQGFPSGLPSAGTCPALDINHQVTQNPDGSWTLTFFALQPRTPGAILQSVDAVAVTAMANANPTTTRAMDRVNGLVWEWDIPTALKAGDTLKYAFNYTAMLNGMSVTCNTSQFAFAVSPSSSVAAPAGQPMGATTPMQLAQLQQQMQQSSQFNPFRQPQPQPLMAGGTGAGSQPLMPLGADPNQFQQQPMALPLGSAMGSAMAPMAPGMRSAADVVRGTVSEVCPSISFAQKLEPNPNGGGVAVTFTGDKALKGTLQTLNFVDFHLSVSGSPDVNVRMTQGQTPLTWTYTLPLNSVPAGATYYFTHCSTIGGARVDCDTPQVTVSSAIAGGQGAIVPQPLMAPTSPYGAAANSMQPLMQVGTPQTPQQMLLQSQSNGNPIQPLQAPQQPQQPQTLQQPPALPSGYGQPTQPLPLLSPSGVLSQPTGAGAGATGTPAGAGAANLPCPAIQWSYSMVPANSVGAAGGSTANANAYRLVFTSGRALRPDVSVTRLNYVDAHYNINGAAPVNVNMRSVAPASGSATSTAAAAAAAAAAGDGTTWIVDGLKLNPGDTIVWYHTYSVTLGATAVQCDTGLQSFVVPPQFGAQPPAPSTTAAGTNAAALLSGVPALGNALGLTPSGAGAGAGAGANGALPAGLVCPAILFDKQILPLGNTQYQLSFIANTAANPTATLQAINFVDAHYVVNNAQQINTHMVKRESASPPTFTLPLTLQPGSTLAVYFTYSALLSSGTTAVQCDTAVFSFAN